jgi:hypothetical protein
MSYRGTATAGRQIFIGIRPCLFAHNEIEINAPCATVWDHLVRAQLWPEWCSFSGKVKIWDRSPTLQKNTRFSWRGLDLPQDGAAAFRYPPKPLNSKVIEYVPESRIGWLWSYD